MTTRAARRRARSRSSPIPQGIPRASRSTSARRRSSSASPPTAPSTAARSAATPSRRTSPAPTGKSAVGLKVKRGKLYVAGGETGSITVYDIATKAQVAKFETGSGGFLNDLLVTRNGDVYVTDSFRPTLWHVTREQVDGGLRHAAGARRQRPIPYRTGEFNLNGIVAKSARKLVVVDSNSGKLFRIKLGHDGDAIDSIDEITGATVPGGDGMLLDNGRLVVVQGDPRRSCRSSSSRTAPAGRSSSARRRATSSAARRRSTGRRASTSW